MQILRKIDPVTGSTKETVTLSAAENNALDQAHEIIRKRSEKEGIEMDHGFSERVEYWLLGIMRFDDTGNLRTSEEDGITAALEMAQNAPFQEKPKRIVRGYA